MATVIEKQKRLDEYLSQDSVTFPAYTFFYKEVVSAYGICPYIQLAFKHLRENWLAESFDQGANYREIVRSIQTVTIYDTDMEGVKEELIREVSKLEGSSELIEKVKERSETVSMNKTKRASWNQTLLKIDEFSEKNKFDFVKFCKVCFGYSVRYKSSSDGSSEVAKLIADFVKLDQKRDALIDKMLSCKKNALDQLSRFIESNYKIDQQGKYFKKWSSLPEDRKHERIVSYCEWYITQNQLSPMLIKDLAAFIEDKIASKELKAADVVWSSKMGIIKKINVIVRNDEFSIVTVEKRKRSKEIASKELIGKEMLQRMNRLVLFEILKGHSLNKQKITDTVLQNLNISRSKSDSIGRQIMKTYDDMLDVVSKNPINM